MPAALDRCVTALMKDPKFKPRDPKQTKESAAYAVCTAQLKKFDDKVKEVTDIMKTINFEKEILKKK